MTRNLFAMLLGVALPLSSALANENSGSVAAAPSAFALPRLAQIVKIESRGIGIARACRNHALDLLVLRDFFERRDQLVLFALSLERL